MRVLTRGDLDGLTSIVLLTEVHPITDIWFAHPKDVQDGKVEVTEEDIIVNLPYVPGCGLWFDHHVSEDRKLKDIGHFEGRFEVAPSTARVIYNHYNRSEFEQYDDMLEETDRLDSGSLSMEDVTDPKRWILLGLTLDPRTGLGPEFRKYFRWLVEYVKEVPLVKVLQHKEVARRIERVLADQEAFKIVLKAHSKLDGGVVVTDLRGVTDVPVGNRFLVYTIFPESYADVRIFGGKLGNTVLAAGHSIFNRACDVNVGELFSSLGGGGHRSAGTCQVPNEKAEETISLVVKKLKENK